MAEPAASDSEARLERGDWLRLSPWAVGFIFIRIIVDFVRNNIPALAGAGAGVALVERIGMREVGLIGVVALLGVALVCLLHHRRFAFRLEGDTLLVRRGIIERTELKVRAARIQHMAIEQPLYLRLFGLVRLSVDTPGGAAAQVELPGIPVDLANALHTRLAMGVAAPAVAAGTDADGVAAAEDIELYRINRRGLILHGIASNYAYVLAAAAAPFLGQIESLLRWLLADTALAASLQTLAARPWLSAPALALAVLAALIAISVIVVWLRFSGFVLTRVDGRFRQRSGLLNRQEQALSRARLQSVEQVQTAVGRVLGRSHLICRQIGAVLPGQESAARIFVVPGLARHAADSLATVFWPGLDHTAPLQRVSRYYIRALLVRWSLALVLLLMTLAVFAGNFWPLAALPAVAPLAWPFAWLRWRTVGYAFDADYLRVRRGLIGQRTLLFPMANVQRLAISQSLLQRWRGIASVTLTLASGPIGIPCLAKEDADRLANLTLYRVESDAVAPTADNGSVTS